METYSEVFRVFLFLLHLLNLLITFLKKLYLLLQSLKGKIDVVVVVCAIFTSVYGFYYSVWAVPYGDSMLCVLTLSLPSWFCAISLLKYTWMWAIIQRAQDVCDS